MSNDYIQKDLHLQSTRRFQNTWTLLNRPSDFINQLIHDYGGFVHYRGIINFYLINEPELIRQVLKDTHRSFDKNTPIYNRFRNALGNSLVNAEGEHWKRQRKLMQPAFGPAAIKTFFATMLASSTSMIERWKKHVDTNQSFNFSDEMNKLTLEIAGKSLFNDGFDRHADKIRDWTRVINRYSAKPPIPIIGHPDFPTPINLQLKQTLRDYNHFITEMIEKRIQHKSEPDLLSALLSMKDETTGEPMKITEVAEEVLGMIIGGHETSSTALSWIFYELSRHPEIEKKVIAEIANVTQGAAISFEHITNLKETKAVIEETMRLHPPLWFENRNATQATKLNGQLIPAGSMVVFSRYALHRNSKIWKNPDKFEPSRFLSENSDQSKAHKASGAYIPFSSGPRVCIGRHFAMTELIVILVNILQNFCVSVSAKNNFKVSTNLTMELKDGLQVNISNR